jgi:hypothetical protein
MTDGGRTSRRVLKQRYLTAFCPDYLILQLELLAVGAELNAVKNPKEKVRRRDGHACANTRRRNRPTGEIRDLLELSSIV